MTERIERAHRGDPTILLSAGEPSGDLHGAAVARALLRRWPNARLFGLGGPGMAAAGVELLADFHDLAVMGFAEVAGRVPFFLKLLGRLKSEIRARGTDLVLPIDYPGFNLRLAKAARAHPDPQRVCRIGRRARWDRCNRRISIRGSI